MKKNFDIWCDETEPAEELFKQVIAKELRKEKVMSAKTGLGLFLMICGIGIGIYVGVWLCFIGGIVQIIEQVKAPYISGIQVGFGVLRIFSAGLCGTLAGIFLFIPGLGILKGDL
jgi:hypothetical protein